MGTIISVIIIALAAQFTMIANLSHLESLLLITNNTEIYMYIFTRIDPLPKSYSFCSLFRKKGKSQNLKVS